MISAEISWMIANRNAMLASQTLAVMPLENPAMLIAVPVGVCSRPYAPRPTDTATPITTAISSAPVPLPCWAGGPGGGGGGGSWPGLIGWVSAS
jgi:hypothetical protein